MDASKGVVGIWMPVKVLLGYGCQCCKVSYLTTKNAICKLCFGSLASRMQHFDMFIWMRPKYVQQQHETKKFRTTKPAKYPQIVE